ncbi:hypothetical protein DL98DRAFT_227971 [Cadophora sp. DSE1049]|nr:hypothetical protein DL98DRAFT_227971 [Cadophora sp. DSE1049]
MDALASCDPRRDWIPVLVGAEMGSEYTLTHVNAVIARVNLFCKVMSPMILPVIISAFSRKTWIPSVALVTVAIWGLEMYCLRIVSMGNPHLLAPKKQESSPELPGEGLGMNVTSQMSILKRAENFLYRHPAQRLRPLFDANLACSDLHGIPLPHSSCVLGISYHILTSKWNVFTTTRASGSLMGFVATFTTPLASGYLHRRLAHSHAGKGIVPRKLSSWGITGQFLSLVSLFRVSRLQVTN